MSVTVIVDLSGNPITASETFVQLVSEGWSHTPRSVDEAITLYRYLIKSQIDPALAGFLNKCVVSLTPAEKELVKKAIFRSPRKPWWHYLLCY